MSGTISERWYLDGLPEVVQIQPHHIQPLFSGNEDGTLEDRISRNEKIHVRRFLGSHFLWLSWSHFTQDYFIIPQVTIARVHKCTEWKQLILQSIANLTYITALTHIVVSSINFEWKNDLGEKVFHCRFQISNFNI